MRIEILVGNESPNIVPLNGDKHMVGSSVNCDIIVKAEGISRKHLQLVQENGVVYAIDQGSTNGSFINEERLVPGRKTEFTTFFPIRLGYNVLISLIAADDIEQSSTIMKPMNSIMGKTDDATRTRTEVLPADLAKNKTSKLIEKRDEKRNQKAGGTATKETKKEKGSSNPLIPIVAIILFALAAYYNLYMMDDESVDTGVPIEQAAP